MALEDILEMIRREAEEEATGVIGAAEARAASLLQEARGEAARKEDELAHASDDGIRLLWQRATSLAQLDAAREWRATRERMFQSVMDRVARRLGSLRSDDRYGGVLELLLDEALAVLPEPSVVRADPGDMDAVKRLLSERNLAVAVQPIDDCWGGVHVAGDGRVVKNDLATRLENANPHLRYLAGELLPALRGNAP